MAQRIAVPAAVPFDEIDGVVPGNPTPITPVVRWAKSGLPFVIGIFAKLLFWPMYYNVLFQYAGMLYRLAMAPEPDSSTISGSLLQPDEQ
jgi:hypothetical protein